VFCRRGGDGSPGERLDLTSEQREAARAVLAGHARTLSTQIDAVVAARRSLFAAIHAPQLDESAVRGASAAVASAETELALTRARIASELRPLLSEEQRAELALLREDVSGLIDLVVDRVRARLLALAS
jgi:Spy/CpxP family protein refolding chaperone